MRLLITGGTGFIGQALCSHLIRHGHEVFVLTRQSRRLNVEKGDSLSPIRFLEWEGSEWPHVLETCDGLVNLAGESIASKRWSRRQKIQIRESRIQSTHRLVDAMTRLSRRPNVLINASAIGYYGPHSDELLDESAPAGKGFLAHICQMWENEASRAESLGVRVIRLRIGLVLAAGAGALAKMVDPFRFFVGGVLGSGRQWVSWIHRDDLVALIEWLLSHAQVTGAVNATAPEPVTMRAFCRSLADRMHRPCWVPVPAVALRVMLGEMATLLLTGQRVFPRVCLQAGYRFRYGQLLPALEACLSSSVGHR